MTKVLAFDKNSDLVKLYFEKENIQEIELYCQDYGFEIMTILRGES